MAMTADGKTVLHRPAAGWIGGLAATLLIGATGIGFSVVAVALLFSGSWSIGAAIFILAAWMLILANYVWCDCQARRKWRIEIEPGELLLDLPTGRSLMEAGRRVKRFLEVSDIASIETRLEAYRSFGMANMQRNYGLRLRSGDIIVLGEDRALASALRDETMGGFVEAIRLKTGLPLRDLGMVEGEGGLFGLLFTSVPRWDMPSVPATRQAALWRRVATTGWMAGTVLLAGFMLSMTF